jgi:threonine dehydrogenase-like Zn-dependent dehydrogenase
MTMAVVDEITVIGSRCGPFAPAIALLASRRVDPRPVLDHTFALGDALKAIEVSQEPGVLKVLLQCSGET